MGESLTHEQVKQKHLERMGCELGTVYSALENELAYLNVKWNEYVELFGTSPARVDLLNQSAPTFFRIVQDSLWEDILLHIARLTDPPRSVGKTNLSIQQLPALVDAKTGEDIKKQVSVAIDKTSFCRDWRNRHIAHRDLALSKGDQAEPLMPASRAAVKDALHSISTVLNTVAQRYMGAKTIFDLAGDSSDAYELLCVLDDGVKAKNNRRERLVRGEGLPEDYAPRNL